MVKAGGVLDAQAFDERASADRDRSPPLAALNGRLEIHHVAIHARSEPDRVSTADHFDP
jgi:hypothetical protein